MGAKSRRMPRKAKVHRRTTETDVAVELELDGQGRFRVETGLPFFDHMLAQLAEHGLFNRTLRAKGDLKVDPHHTMEDVGLALGEAFAQALGNRANIRRYGQATGPMDAAPGWGGSRGDSRRWGSLPAWSGSLTCSGTRQESCCRGWGRLPTGSRHWRRQDSSIRCSGRSDPGSRSSGAVSVYTFSFRRGGR